MSSLEGDQIQRLYEALEDGSTELHACILPMLAAQESLPSVALKKLTPALTAALNDPNISQNTLNAAHKLLSSATIFLDPQPANRVYDTLLEKIAPGKKGNYQAANLLSERYYALSPRRQNEFLDKTIALLKASAPPQSSVMYFGGMGQDHYFSAYYIRPKLLKQLVELRGPTDPKTMTFLADALKGDDRALREAAFSEAVRMPKEVPGLSEAILDYGNKHASDSRNVPRLLQAMESMGAAQGPKYIQLLSNLVTNNKEMGAILPLGRVPLADYDEAKRALQKIIANTQPSWDLNAAKTALEHLTKRRDLSSEIASVRARYYQPASAQRDRALLKTLNELSDELHKMESRYSEQSVRSF